MLVATARRGGEFPETTPAVPANLGSRASQTGSLARPFGCHRIRLR
jgi:hypothetical protein